MCHSLDCIHHSRSDLCSLKLMSPSLQKGQRSSIRDRTHPRSWKGFIVLLKDTSAECKLVESVSTCLPTKLIDSSPIMSPRFLLIEHLHMTCTLKCTPLTWMLSDGCYWHDDKQISRTTMKIIYLNNIILVIHALTHPSVALWWHRDDNSSCSVRPDKYSARETRTK